MSERLPPTESETGVPGEAELWFARLLRSDCPIQVRRAFEHWLAADPAHAAAYREVEHLWTLGGEAAVHDPAVMAAAQQALHQPHPRGRASRRRFIPALAAAAVLLVAVLAAPLWLGLVRDRPAGTPFSTAVGQLRTLTLADGSSVVLDTDSKILVRYSTHERRVDLLRGRAQFHDVSNGGRRPFEVHAQGGTVTAVGTKFEVGVGNDEANVILLQGKVIVHTPARDGQSHSVTLDPGQQVAFGRSGMIGPVQAADLKAANGWIEGKLFVHDWYLPHLLAQMNRYSTTQLVIGDPSLKGIRIGGVFRAGDQHALLSTLANVWGIRAEHVSPTRVVLRK